jgi:flagellar biosynthesis/type III secretory pathway protein FliH
VSEIRGFLASLPGAQTVTSFASSLPVHDTGPVTSPWLPQPAAPAQISAAPPPDFEALRAEAVAAGVEEGRRETRALRARLTQLVEALTAAQAELPTIGAAQISEAATTVVEAWTGAASSAERFAPIVRGWLARTPEAAIASLHPDEVEGFRELIEEVEAEASIKIVGDPTIARGELRIRAATYELVHRWSDRLSELREAIHTAIEDAAIDAASLEGAIGGAE